MNSKFCCSLERRQRLSDFSKALILTCAAVSLPLFAMRIPGRDVLAASTEAPAWMHGLVSVALPEHDDKTEAVKLLSETIVTVQSVDKIKTQVRVAYKILRPGGRDLGTPVITYHLPSKVANLRAWCIPAQGKDYEVKDKDAMEVALPAIAGSELVNDVRAKIVRIPRRVVFPEQLSGARRALYAAAPGWLGVQSRLDESLRSSARVGWRKSMAVDGEQCSRNPRRSRNAATPRHCRPDDRVVCAFGRRRGENVRELARHGPLVQRLDPQPARPVT
jgi:hypothetical protein